MYCIFMYKLWLCTCENCTCKPQYYSLYNDHDEQCSVHTCSVCACQPSLNVKLMYSIMKSNAFALTKQRKVKPHRRIKVMLKPPKRLWQNYQTSIFHSSSKHTLTGKRQDTPWTGHQSIIGLKQECNHQHVCRRCLKMLAHNHRRHALSGSLAVRQMALVLHSC